MLWQDAGSNLHRGAAHGRLGHHTGHRRVRHCGECNKNVYNLSEMTRRQGEALLREKEGQLCARLYRRADGTILTSNCPAGLRAIGHGISRLAGEVMSAVMTLSSATA